MLIFMQSGVIALQITDQRKKEQPVKRIFRVLPLILLVLSGCAANIRNVSSDIKPAESVVVGRIQTVPIFWDFGLFEERSKTEDRIEIAGSGYGVTKASRLQNEGYVFKTIRPGVYMLRLRKVQDGEYANDDILRIQVDAGSLVYFGTVKVVVDEVIVDPSQLHARALNRAPLKLKYHFVGIDEEATLRHFEKQYPEAYAAFKKRIVRIRSKALPKEYILLHGALRLAGGPSAKPGGRSLIIFAKEVQP
jgi:hypothetical protein